MGRALDRLACLTRVYVPPYVRVNDEGNVENVDGYWRETGQRPGQPLYTHRWDTRGGAIRDARAQGAKYAPKVTQIGSDEPTKPDRFGWNPKVGDRVEGVGAHGGTGHFGTVIKRRRDGFVIEWDEGGRSVHQSYGFRLASEPSQGLSGLARLSRWDERRVQTRVIKALAGSESIRTIGQARDSRGQSRDSHHTPLHTRETSWERL